MSIDQYSSQSKNISFPNEIDNEKDYNINEKNLKISLLSENYNEINNQTTIYQPKEIKNEEQIIKNEEKILNENDLIINKPVFNENKNIILNINEQEIKSEVIQIEKKNENLINEPIFGMEIKDNIILNQQNINQPNLNQQIPILGNDIIEEQIYLQTPTQIQVQQNYDNLNSIGLEKK
jgi:hypothetical protein